MVIRLMHAASNQGEQSPLILMKQHVHNQPVCPSVCLSVANANKGLRVARPLTLALKRVVTIGRAR